MDMKVLVGGVVGLGLLAGAGILILGGGGSDSDFQPTNATGSSTVDIDPGASAYDIPELSDEPLYEGDLETDARDLQAPRGNRGRDRGGRDRFADMEQRMMEFDVDGDGILDQDERDAMAQSFRDRMTERFDQNGDGVVTIDEQFAARREFMMDSRRGQRMRDEFDSDGDGTLNEAELAAMNAELDARDADRMAEIVAEYDTDGDGKMSIDETLAMQDQQFSEQRSRMDEFTLQFDQDGDGNLDADERLDVRDTMIERREIESFLRRYDTGGDREIGPSDSERFTDAYGKKEPYADVNRDGIYNMDDVVMFRDMTERVNAKDD